ncbi:unnamed protein product, partial [Scytosiphon promiscuus]
DEEQSEQLEGGPGMDMNDEDLDEMHEDLSNCDVAGIAADSYAIGDRSQRGSEHNPVLQLGDGGGELETEGAKEGRRASERDIGKLAID